VTLVKTLCALSLQERLFFIRTESKISWIVTNNDAQLGEWIGFPNTYQIKFADTFYLPLTTVKSRLVFAWVIPEQSCVLVLRYT